MAIGYEVRTLFDFDYCHVSRGVNRRLQPSPAPLIPVVCARQCLSPQTFVTCQIKNDGSSITASTNYGRQRFFPLFFLYMYAMEFFIHFYNTSFPFSEIF